MLLLIVKYDGPTCVSYYIYDKISLYKKLY